MSLKESKYHRKIQNNTKKSIIDLKKGRKREKRSRAFGCHFIFFIYIIPATAQVSGARQDLDFRFVRVFPTFCSCRWSVRERRIGTGVMANGYDYSFKILLIGDSGVGKSSLLVSFISSHVEELSPTIGDSSFFVSFFFLLLDLVWFFSS